MFEIANKVILISGGCGGIGFALAKELLKKQAKVSRKSIKPQCLIYNYLD